MPKKTAVPKKTWFDEWTEGLKQMRERSRAEREARRAPLVKRIAELREMRDGWLDGDGIRPTEQAADATLKTLFQLEDSLNFPNFGVFATPKGDIQVEAEVRDFLIEAVFRADGASMALTATAKDRNGHDYPCLVCSDPDSFKHVLRCFLDLLVSTTPEVDSFGL